MNQSHPLIVLGWVWLMLCLLVLIFWWVQPSDEPPTPCAQPAIVYIVVTASPTPIVAPTSVARTPVPPLVLNEEPERLPRETVTRVSTATLIPGPTETPTPDRPAVQRG